MLGAEEAEYVKDVRLGFSGLPLRFGVINIAENKA
jgi:hypothetical protein